MALVCTGMWWDCSRMDLWCVGVHWDTLECDGMLWERHVGVHWSDTGMYWDAMGQHWAVL